MKLEILHKARSVNRAKGSDHSWPASSEALLSSWMKQNSNCSYKNVRQTILKGMYISNSPRLYQVVHKLREFKVPLWNENDAFLVIWLQVNNECLQWKDKISLKQKDDRLVVMQNEGSQQSSSDSFFNFKA